MALADTEGMVRRLVATVVSLLVLTSAAWAEPYWSRELERDLVRVTDDQLRYVDHALCRFDPPEGGDARTPST